MNESLSAEFMAERERVIRDVVVILRRGYQRVLERRMSDAAKEVQSEQPAA